MTKNSPTTTTTTTTKMTAEKDPLLYQSGFGNTFESECLPGALPRGRNNPRHPPYGLYTEQLSGTAFTAPRAVNQRVWLYRIQTRVAATSTSDAQSMGRYLGHCDPNDCRTNVNPLRWRPPPSMSMSSSSQPSSSDTDGNSTASATTVDFVDGCRLVCHGGSPQEKNGLAIYIYRCNQSMRDRANRCLVNTDGDFLLVPQQGGLEIITELGKLRVAPTEIAVIPRGMVFQINLLPVDSSTSSDAIGYVLEVYRAGGFQLPELGPLGSNGLANARDFRAPVAWCVPSPAVYHQPHTLVTKASGELFVQPTRHSPFNVVAWHGNYVPYKYDLQRFCVVNSVSFDHPDPSIFTVLTCPSDTPGTALADFVIFPPRVFATDAETFRPPWFHRNTMSEFMGLIHGEYDAKQQQQQQQSDENNNNNTEQSPRPAAKGGFVPGGASLHPCMTPHGPDSATFEKATGMHASEAGKPILFAGGLAMMFETYLPLQVSPQALEDTEWRDIAYARDCWEGLHANRFTGWDALQKANQEL